MGLQDIVINVERSVMNLFQRQPPPTQPQESGVGIGQRQPPWEATAPQYPEQSVYTLAQAGYRRNEIMYACIQKRMVASAEAPCMVWDGDPDDPETKRLSEHPARVLLRRPNDFMDENMFWQAVRLYKDVAGFSVWEKQYNNRGEVYAIYPLRPDWCSFMRGPDQLLKYVRYQPPGLDYMYVPVTRCLVFMELDPVWMGVRAISRSAVGSRVGTADNAATDFVTTFFQNGAQFNGIYKVQQHLEASEAKEIQELITKQHGGAQNWSNPLVLGDDANWSPTTMSFKDMDFNSIDGRDESRICAIFNVPPILIGAKVGLSASTYSNYKEARQAFYEEAITQLWNENASVIERQLLPEYSSDLRASFDTRHVKALQEDRTAIFTRAGSAFSMNWLCRDEARTEAGFDPVDGANKVFYSDVQALTAEARKGDVVDTAAEDQSGEESAPGVVESEEAAKDATKAVPLKQRDGVMVGFFLSTHDARQITPADSELPPGAKREDTLHLTLAFLGKTQELEPRKKMIINAIDGFADGHAPMIGHVQGIGKFNGVEDGESDCIYASYDAVNLAQFRTELVRLLASIGVFASEDHGFVPHIALAYVTPSNALPSMTMPDTPITFPALTLAWGNEHYIAPLRGIRDEPVPEMSTKALADWRKSCIEALKRGNPASDGIAPAGLPADVVAAIDTGLKGCRSASEVRAVFEQHWPAKAAHVHTEDEHSEAVPQSAEVAALVSEFRELRMLMEGTK